MRQYVLFVALLISFNAAYSQQLPITVIIEEGSLQTGLINFYNVGSLRKSITVQTSNGSETFRTTDIYGFKLTLENGEQEEYRSAIVSYDNPPHAYGEAPLSGRHFVTDTVFLKVLVTGELSLLHMKTRMGKHAFFIQKADASPEYLVQQEYLSNRGDVNGVRTTDQYKKQLLEAFKPCASVKPDHIYHSTYSERSLTQLFAQYNKCTRSLQGTPLKGKPMEVHVYFLAGIATAKLKISSTSPYFGNLKFNRTTSMAAGGGVELFPLTRNKRVALDFSVLGSHFSTSSDSFTYMSMSGRDVYIYSFEMTRLKLNVGVRYHFVKNAIFDVHALAGVSNGLNLITENRVDYWISSFGVTNYDQRDALPETRRHEQAIFFGAGAIYRRFGLQWLHERGNGFSPISGIATMINTNYLMLSFRL